MNKIQVAIIGAGTAGLSARQEIAKVTDEYRVFDPGPLGTTCARVGCMPSKALIQIANHVHSTHHFDTMGIRSSPATVDSVAVMNHVRHLRDRFVRGVLQDMEPWQATHLVRKKVKFLDANTLDVESERFQADKIIIATGSEPKLPTEWTHVRHLLVDSGEFFELASLPKSIAVIGLGSIGTELSQALARLGVKVIAISSNKKIAGLTDPFIQNAAMTALAKEFIIDTSSITVMRELKDTHTGESRLEVTTASNHYIVEKALVAVGRRPVVKNLGLDTLNIALDDDGLPELEPGTYRIKGTDIFLVGDANGERPILHEASDEGRIAGYNAMSTKHECFQRRVALGITFSDPNIALVGQTHRQLKERGIAFVTGHASFRGQGRAIVKHRESGEVHIYADAKQGVLLGAELFAPDGEHHAHLLAWAIEAKLTVRETLARPFYHPTTEEGLRTALRHAARQLETAPPTLEMLRCADAVVK